MATYKPKEPTKEGIDGLLEQVKSNNQIFYNELNKIWNNPPSPKVDTISDKIASMKTGLTEKEKLVESLIRCGAINIREALVLLNASTITINQGAFDPISGDFPPTLWYTTSVAI